MLEIIARHAVVDGKSKFGRRRTHLGVAGFRCLLEHQGIAALVHRMALFIRLAGRQITGSVTDGASRGARVVGIAEFLHEVAALAAIEFARKLAGDITPGTR